MRDYGEGGSGEKACCTAAKAPQSLRRRKFGCFSGFFHVRRLPEKKSKVLQNPWFCSTSFFVRNYSSSGASTGHTLAQEPQLMHAPEITYAMGKHLQLKFTYLLYHTKSEIQGIFPMLAYGNIVKDSKMLHLCIFYWENNHICTWPGSDSRTALFPAPFVNNL